MDQNGWRLYVISVEGHVAILNLRVQRFGGRTVYSRDITSGRVIERVKRSRSRNWWRNRRDLEACMLLIINCSESVVETMLRGS